jgi:hypothetical protein
MNPSPAVRASRRSLACIVLALALAASTQAAEPGDKTPQHPTIGPAVPLSAAQQAAIAAKPIVVLPAPESSANVADKGGAFVAPVPPSAMRPVPAAALAAAPGGASVTERPGPARPIRVSTAWTVSPALGEIPRPDWKLPPWLVKPADHAWVTTPAGGRRVPIEGAENASGGER